ncbi:MAG: class II fructose-1,6-bisphosphate aldolase [Ruminococcaceae bacterium]|nr:class II fructose-1,6-bisphosphate aldolase [Oscillospiraceae bacterium]
MALVTTAEMFRQAYAGGYAIGAFNFNNMETVQAITEACREERSPVIIQVSQDVTENHTYMVKLAQAAAEECPDLPMALHLDHGRDFETCKFCIDGGYTSVMIDASALPFEENVALTRRVVEYAHDRGVVVEAELGALAGVEDHVDVSADKARYTNAEEAAEFVARTGCDSLAIAMGTSHGAYKFKPGTKPALRFDILEEIMALLPGFPLVLHGASSVPAHLIETVNRFGGVMPGAVGIPDEQLRKASALGVCKINVASDTRIAITAAVRRYLAENPSHFDPRQYLAPARREVKEMVRQKLRDVLGSAGKAEA